MHKNMYVFVVKCIPSKEKIYSKKTKKPQIFFLFINFFTRQKDEVNVPSSKNPMSITHFVRKY